MDANDEWPAPTQWLSGPYHTKVVDYDGESLKVSYSGGNHYVVFDSQGEGGLYLSVEDARRFLTQIEELLDSNEGNE